MMLIGTTAGAFTFGDSPFRAVPRDLGEDLRSLDWAVFPRFATTFTRFAVPLGRFATFLGRCFATNLARFDCLAAFKIFGVFVAFRFSLLLRFFALLTWAGRAFRGDDFEADFFGLVRDFFAVGLDDLDEAFLLDLGIPEEMKTIVPAA